jgi:hypothetical protein
MRKTDGDKNPPKLFLTGDEIMAKCDRCWKETPEDELITVPTDRLLPARFCKECARLTGNLPPAGAD